MTLPTTGPDAAALVLWLHVDPDELDRCSADVGQLADGSAVTIDETEAQYLTPGRPCRRLECQNRATVALVLREPAPARWVPVCSECWRVACTQARPACPRPCCRRTSEAAGQWCERDRATVLASISVAPARWSALTAPGTLLARGQGRGAPVTGTKTPPLPLNQAAWTLADELHGAYVGTASWLTSVPLGVDRQNAGRQIAWCSRALQQGLDRLLAHDLDSGEHGRELAWHLVQLETRAMRTLGLDEQRPARRDLPCQACDLRTLITVPGQDLARCETCGLTETDDAYRVRARRWIAYGRAHRDDLDEAAAS